MPASTLAFLVCIVLDSYIVREKAFEKVVLSQVKSEKRWFILRVRTEQIKEVDGVTKVLPLKKMEKYSIATEKNPFLKIFLIFFTKISLPYNYKANR